MNRIYHPYQEWECYQNGMYSQEKDNDIDLIEKSRNLLSDKDATMEAMTSVILSWKKSCEHYLTDLSSNRRAWLGQAACCFEHGSSEQATCKAWWQLTDEQRFVANAVADSVINEWEQEHVGGGVCLKLDLV